VSVVPPHAGVCFGSCSDFPLRMSELSSTGAILRPTDVCRGRCCWHSPLTAPCGCGIRGGALCLRAKLLAQSGVEAEAVKMLQLAAVKKFEAAVEINPHSTQALRSWGLALQDAAELTPHDAADAMELLSQVRVFCTLVAVCIGRWSVTW
jgi:hypothetical protein